MAAAKSAFFAAQSGHPRTASDLDRIIEAAYATGWTFAYAERAYSAWACAPVSAARAATYLYAGIPVAEACETWEPRYAADADATAEALRLLAGLRCRQ